MIVKKLRQKNNWSQEQLANFCDVSLRTIQRVEAGNRASLETLKALASVFDVEISKLTKEIIVIDKQTEEWRSEPLWVKLGVIGIRKRFHLILIEYFMISAGFVMWYLYPSKVTIPLTFFFAYLNAKLVSYLDRKNYW